MKNLKVDCECCVCHKIFKKRKAEITRQRKLGRDYFYCSLQCVGKRHNDHLRSNRIRCTEKQKPFRIYFTNAKKRAKTKNMDFDIDIPYLEKLWISQNGLCKVTNLKLEHNIRNTNKTPYQASLDRIDNSKGYIKGNVRFTCLIFNYARNGFTDEDVLEFCRLVNGKSIYS